MFIEYPTFILFLPELATGPQQIHLKAGPNLEIISKINFNIILPKTFRSLHWYMYHSTFQNKRVQWSLSWYILCSSNAVFICIVLVPSRKLWHMLKQPMANLRIAWTTTVSLATCPAWYSQAASQTHCNQYYRTTVDVNPSYIIINKNRPAVGLRSLTQM